MQSASSSELAHFFDDVVSLCSWVFSGCCDIKQVLCKISVNQQMRATVSNLIPGLRSCAVHNRYTLHVSNCGYLREN